MIARETIDRISTPSASMRVVSDFVQQKAWHEPARLCPFHNEKTPSFNVNPVRNIYKCFGCGKGGDAVNFVMEHEHYSYPEALRYLAKRYNIEIEETAPDPQEAQLRRTRKPSTSPPTATRSASFPSSCSRTRKAVPSVLSYFRERGFSEETIKTFNLGFSRPTGARSPSAR